MAFAQTSNNTVELTISEDIGAEVLMQLFDLENRTTYEPKVKSTADIESISSIQCVVSKISDPLTVSDKQLQSDLPNGKRLCRSNGSVRSQSIENLNTNSSSVSLKRSTSWPSGRFVVSSRIPLDELSWYDPLSDSMETLSDMNSITVIMTEFENRVLLSCNSDEAKDFVAEFLPSLSEPLLLFVMRHSYRVPPRFREVYSKFEEWGGPFRSFHHRLFNHRQSQRALKLSYNHSNWQPDGECVVCYRVNGGLSRTCCSHIVCESCLTLYFQHMVENEGRVQIACPACQKLCQREEITSHLSQATKDKFYRFLHANNDANKKTCPQCSFITERPKRNPTRHEKKYGLTITCEVCLLKWCFNCHAPSHTMSCKKFIAGNGLFRQWTKEMVDGPNSSRNARKCPGCQIFIQRSEGCNHMHCSRCNTGFCYACGCKMRSYALLGGHDNRLSVLGCKRSLHPDHPHLRRFVRGSLLGVGVAVSPLILIGACVGGLGFGIALGSKIIVKKTKRRIRRRRLARAINTGEIVIEHPHYLNSTGISSLDDFSSFEESSTSSDFEDDQPDPISNAATQTNGTNEETCSVVEKSVDVLTYHESQKSARQIVDSHSKGMQPSAETIMRISSSDYLTSL